MTSSPAFQAPAPLGNDGDGGDDEDYGDYGDEPERQRPARLSPHFFRRENDGSVKLRLKLTAEEAALIEEAAGKTPLMLYIHRVLGERAKYHVSKNNQPTEAKNNEQRA